MIVAFVADLHGNLPPIPKCDVLVIAGDVCPVYDHERHFQRAWLRGPFTDWLLELAEYGIDIVGVGGNHDFVLGDPGGYELGRSLPWNYLDNESTEIHGLKIWGSPYSNRFGRWAFMEEEETLAELWDDIPEGLDILITHGPPYGVGDYVNNDWGDAARDKHVGSKSLTEVVRETKPRVHVFGHIHEGYGTYAPVYVSEAGIEISTESINASFVTEHYVPGNPIRVLEL